jgi:AcrR family transcriptional regulator
VPRLWDETIEAHRRAVRDATLDTTAALVAEHGLASVTMSQIAEQTGIGRATLYKYSPDVEAILVAWHEREVTGHLAQLASVRDRAGRAGERGPLQSLALSSPAASWRSNRHFGITEADWRDALAKAPGIRDLGVAGATWSAGSPRSPGTRLRERSAQWSADGVGRTVVAGVARVPRRPRRRRGPWRR